jgi:hypothetical protein
MVYMMAFIITNSFLNIIAAAQYIQLWYNSSGTANAVVSVLAFGKYFFCGVKWGAPELDMSHFAIFDTDAQRGASENVSLLKYYLV